MSKAAVVAMKCWSGARCVLGSVVCDNLICTRCALAELDGGAIGDHGKKSDDAMDVSTSFYYSLFL